MKELRSEIAANEHEALQLAATHQHLRRQQQGLAERLARLEQQAAARRDAADAGVERQLRDKEAILAENAAAVAKLAENEAAVGVCYGGGVNLECVGVRSGSVRVPGL